MFSCDFAKSLGTPFCRTIPDDCFFILQVHKNKLTKSVKVRPEKMTCTFYVLKEQKYHQHFFFTVMPHVYLLPICS